MPIEKDQIHGSHQNYPLHICVGQYYLAPSPPLMKKDYIEIYHMIMHLLLTLSPLKYRLTLFSFIRPKELHSKVIININSDLLHIPKYMDEILHFDKYFAYPEMNKVNEPAWCTRLVHRGREFNPGSPSLSDETLNCCPISGLSLW